MKRMILVPEDAYAKFEQKQKLETSPIVKNMMKTDTEMSSTLQRMDMDDADKQKLYYANLERYLNLKQQNDSQIPTVQIQSNNENKEQPVPSETEPFSDTVVVEHIPKSMRPRATVLLNRLKARPDVITWYKSGQVSVAGKTIPQSNISDLISDALRARKNFNPTGSREFFRVFSKINMPKDLVRNQERWNQLDSTSGEEQIIYSSPQHKIPSEYFRTLVKRHKEASGPKETQKRWLKY